MADDQEVVILDDSGTEHVFPAGFDPQRAIAIVRQQAPKESDVGGLGLASAAKAVPLAAQATTAFAQSPTVAKTTGALARGLTTLGAVGHGIYSGSPSEVIAAPMEGWAAGKGGYFLGKGMQSIAKPVGHFLGRMAPYAQSLSTLGGAQGVGDLAQMAEPNRKDIGVLGMELNRTPVAGEQPPLINDMIARLRQRLAGQ